MEQPKKEALLAWLNFFGGTIPQKGIEPVDSLTKFGFSHVPTLVAFLKQDDNTRAPTTISAAPLEAYTEACKYLESVLVEPLSTALLRPAEAADGDELEIAKILVLLMHEVRLAKEALPFPSSEAVPFGLQWEMAHMLSVLVAPEQWPDDEDSWSYILFESSEEFRRQNEPQPEAAAAENGRTPTATGNLSTPKMPRRVQPVDGSFTAPLPQQRSANDGRRHVNQDIVNSGSGSPLLDSFNSPSVMNARVLRAKEREIKKLKEELAELRYCREEAECSVKDLQQKLAELKYKSDEKVADLRHRIDRDSRAVDRVLVLEPECERLSTENSALVQKVVELTRQRDEAREKADEANHELNWREQSMRSRLSSVHENKKLHDDLRAEIATLRQQLAAAHQETKVEADRTRQKEVELDAVRIEHAEVLRAVREECNSKIELAEDNWALEQRKSADLESRLTEMRNSRDFHAAAAADLKQKLLLLQNSEAQLKTELERVQSQRDELENQRQVLETDMAAEMCKSTELEGRLTEMRSNRDALSRSTVDLKQKIISLKNDKVQLTTEVDRLRAEQSDFDSKMQLLEADLGAEQRKSADLEQRVEEIRSSRDSLAHSAVDFKQQLIVLQKNGSQFAMQQKLFESEKNDLSDKLHQAEAEAEDAQTRLAAMHDSHSVIVERASELERKVALFEKDKRELMTSKARTEAELATLKNEHAALLEHVTDLDDRISDLENDACLLEKDKRELTTSKALVETELATLQNEHGALLEHVTDLDARVSDLESDACLLEKEKCELATSKALTETELVTLKDEHAALLEHVTDLDARVSDLESDVAALSADNDRLYSELQSSEQQTREQVQQTQAREDELQRLNTALTEEQARSSALNKHVDELQTKYQTKVKAVEQLQVSVQQLSEMVEQSAQNDIIRAELDQKRFELDEARIELTALTKTNDELVQQLAEKDAVISELTKKLNEKDTVVNDLAKKLNEKDAAFSDLTTKLDEKDTVVSDLTKKLSEKDTVVSELQSKLATVDNEFEQRSADMFKSPKYLFNSKNASIVSPVNSEVRADHSAFDPAIRQRLSFASIDSRRTTRGSFLNPINAPIFGDDGDDEGDLLESTMVQQDELVVVVVPAPVPNTPHALVQIDTEDVSAFNRHLSVSGPVVVKDRRRRSKSLDNQQLNAARLAELNGRNLKYQPHMRSMYAPETSALGEIDLPETDFRDKENFVPPDPVKSKAPDQPLRSSSASASRFLSVPSPTPKSLKQRTKQFFGKMSLSKDKRGQSPVAPRVLRNEKQARGGSKFDVDFFSPKSVKKAGSIKKTANDSISSRSPLLPTNTSAVGAASLR